MQRVVLGRRTEEAMVRFQWAPAAPPGLDDPELALGLGAVWEDQDLVTYDLAGLRHALDHLDEQFLEDPD